MKLNIYLGVFVSTILSIAVSAQTLFFSENMGTSTSPLVSSYTGYQNFTTAMYTGDADVRTSTMSGGYTGASGNSNVFFTTTGTKNFLISGINSSGYSAIILTFGVNKPTGTVLTNFDVEVSADGITFTPVALTVSTTGGWQLATSTTAIPSTSNLRIRFTNSSTYGYRVDDVILKGTPIPAGITTTQNGDWFTGSTWIGGVVPTAADNVVILHNVTSGAVITRNAATTTSISATSSLAIGNATYTQDGTITVNGIFQINDGGYANGSGTFVYSSTTGTLNFNTLTNFTVNNADKYWPTVSGPFNVNVLNGGLVLNGSRTVGGLFSTANNAAGFGGIAFPGQTLRLNGRTNINFGGYFIDSPIYGGASDLYYQAGLTYGRSAEWTAASGTIAVTPGYPNNIFVTNNTTLNYNNGGTPGPLAMAGNLNIATGSTFDVGFGGGNSGGTLTVSGNLVNNGTYRLGNQSTVDDFRLGGDFTNSGTFDGKFRTTFFIKSGTQTLTNTNAAVLNIPYVSLTTGSTKVVLNSNLLIGAGNSGIAVNFSGGGDDIDINGNTLTIGTTGVANTIAGAGTFSGSATSNLTILGTGNIGTLKFAAGKENLGTFIINRTLPPVTQSICTLASPLNISTSINLLSGIFDLGNNLLTVNSTANIVGGSVNNYIVADTGSGANAGIRKYINGPLNSSFPIGDRYASPDNSQYTPIVLTITGGSYSSAYVEVAVADTKHPNLDAATDFITRYWTVSTGGITSPSNFTAIGGYTAADVNTPALETNYIGNRWNGSVWSNAGQPVDAPSKNTRTIPCVAGAINEITAGVRDQDINVKKTSNNVVYLHNSTYDFGTVPFGSSTPAQFTVQNLGQRALTIFGSALTSITLGQYTYTSTLANGNILGPNGTANFTVSFTPSMVGTFTGYITILNNSIDGTETSYRINFTGMAVTPTPNMNVKANGPIPYGFANVANGSVVANGLNNTALGTVTVGSSVTKDFLIQNLGSAPLLLTGAPRIVIGGNNPGDFTIIPQPSVGTIAPGAAAGFSIRFNPTTAGNRNAVVSIANNDVPKNPYTFYIDGNGDGPEIDLYGNGTQIPSGTAVASTANGTQFGNVDFASGFVTRIFTVSNIGNNTLTLINPTLSGATADFTVTTLPSSLSALNEVSFSLTFDPASLGLKTATVSIANNDFDENPYTFVVQGNGTNFSGCGVGTVTDVIVFQDFETTPTTTAPVWTYTTSQESGSAAIAVTGGSAYGQDRTTLVPKSINSRSFQLPGYSATATTGKSTTIEFAAIDASLYQNLSLNFKLGAYAISPDSSQGVDIGDEVGVFVSRNGGASYTQEMKISGFGNSIWSVVTGTGSATTNYDGNNLALDYGVTTTVLNNGPRDITLNNLPNSAQLRVKIVLTLDFNKELWVIDNVKISGKKDGVSTWNGTAWSPVAPTSTTKAIIDGDYVTGPTRPNISACNIVVNAGKTVTINNGYYFDIQNEITNNGTMVVESGGAIIQHNDASVNSGTNFTVKRTTTPFDRYDYTYWSSPVSTATIATVFAAWRTDYAFQFVTANFSDVVTTATGMAPPDGFDDAPPSPWINASLTSNMEAGRGYAIMAPTTGSFPRTDTPVFTGAINNGVQTYPLGMSGNPANNNDDFNLTGNPYPSAISANTFINTNLPNISGTLYFWTHKGNISSSNPGPDMQNFISSDYAMYNLSGGVATTTVGGTACGICGNAPTGAIASGQGFLVEAQTTANVVYNNAMRSNATANNIFYRSNDTGDSDIVKNRYWLNITNPDGLFSQLLIAYFGNTTLDYDPGYDGIANNNRTHLSFYSFGSTDLKLRIQARPAFDAADTVPLGYSSSVNGSFTIELGNREGVFTDDNTYIYLHDNALDIDHDLKQSAYTFTGTYGVYNGRFEIRYSSAPLSTNQAISIAGDVVVMVKDKTISIVSTIENIDSVNVYDITGKLIVNRSKVGAKNLNIENLVFNDQALIVNITMDNGGYINKKIILK